jgi:uncharacterized membrane protein YbhN (UPF0104 family)
VGARVTCKSWRGSEKRKLAASVDLDSATASADQQRLSATETEQRQRSWWWILLILLAVLLLETWLAGRNRQTALQTA